MPCSPCDGKGWTYVVALTEGGDLILVKRVCARCSGSGCQPLPA